MGLKLEHRPQLGGAGPTASRPTAATDRVCTRLDYGAPFALARRMIKRLSQLAFVSLISLSSLAPGLANPRQSKQGPVTAGKPRNLSQPAGTPLKKGHLKTGKIKVTTFKVKSGSLYTVPPPVDPIAVVFDGYAGEGVALSRVVTTGVDLSADAGVLTPGKVRRAMLSEPITDSKTLTVDGRVGSAQYTKSHDANQPIAVTITSAQPGYEGAKSIRITKARGAKSSYEVDVSGSTASIRIKSGALAGRFEPYLNADVIGVTPAYYPAMRAAGEQIQGQTAQSTPSMQASSTARVVVRGGVNAIPPGSKYRVVNLTTGAEGQWRDAHAETGSFREAIDVSAAADQLAIDVQTGDDPAESDIVVTRYGFKASYQEGLTAGRMPLMKSAFTKLGTEVASAIHPISATRFRAALKAIKLDEKAFEVYGSRNGLSAAEQREFAVVLEARYAPSNTALSNSGWRLETKGSTVVEYVPGIRDTESKPKQWVLSDE